MAYKNSHGSKHAPVTMQLNSKHQRQKHPCFERNRSFKVKKNIEVITCLSAYEKTDAYFTKTYITQCFLRF